MVSQGQSTGRILEGTAPTCLICGDRVETGGPTVCYGCRLDGLIPDLPAYQRAEEYQAIEGLAHRNATKRPPTGNAWLDGTLLRISQLGLPPGALKLPW